MEKAAGYILFLIVANGIIGYCGTAGRALLYLFSLGGLENPAWYFSFLAASLTSVVFGATIYNGCFSVASEVFRKRKSDPLLSSGVNDDELLVGHKTKFLLSLAFLLMVYPSAAPTTASNSDFAIPYWHWIMVQNVCSIITVALFNSLGMMDLLKKKTWRAGADTPLLG